MFYQRSLMVSGLALAAALAGCSGDDGSNGSDGADGTSGTNGAPGVDGVNANPTTISLSFLGRYESNEFDESAAEIVDFDPATESTFVVNANSGQVDIIDSSSPSTPTLSQSLDVAADIATAMSISAGEVGSANSISVSGNTVAVAVAADDTQATGFVAFYQTDGTFLSAVEAGALPDMVTFTPDGNTVLVANEGEPNGDYSVDPEGSLTVIDVSGGAGALTQTNVAQVNFQAFNEGGMAPLTGPVRVSARAESVAQDLEPEYIVVSADSATAYVILQENNSIATLDIASATVTAITGLGFKDHSIPGNELDASDRDNGVNIQSAPVLGVYMPDGADAYDFNGITYVVTANEGDGREYLTEDVADEATCLMDGGFEFDDGDCFFYLDEIRIGNIIEDTDATFSEDLLFRLGIDVDAMATPEEQEAQIIAGLEQANLDRLIAVTDLGVTGDCITLTTTGQPGADCVYEELYSQGARSFTIWNTETFEPVFDSGNEFEVITANRLGANFNNDNDENDGDSRSDAKGPEPEAVEIAQIAGRTYAFVGLERVGGIMVYNITNPETAQFVQYINTRDFTVEDVEETPEAAGDLGPESIRFVAAQDSPTGEPMLIVGNEVSGTTAFFNVSVVTQ